MEPVKGGNVVVLPFDFELLLFPLFDEHTQSSGVEVDVEPATVLEGGTAVLVVVLEGGTIVLEGGNKVLVVSVHLTELFADFDLDFPLFVVLVVLATVEVVVVDV